MDLLSYVTLDCPATYSVSDISYQSSSGKMTVTADYTTDMEGRDCNLTMAFDSVSIRSPNTTVEFVAVSETLPLEIVEYQEELMTIRTIFYAISYIALIVFVLSLGHKMLGAEVMVNLQLVYLSNAFYKHSHFFFNELRRLHLVNGYWSLFWQQETDTFILSPFSTRLDISADFG